GPPALRLGLPFRLPGRLPLPARACFRQLVLDDFGGNVLLEVADVHVGPGAGNDGPGGRAGFDVESGAEFVQVVGDRRLRDAFDRFRVRRAAGRDLDRLEGPWGPVAVAAAASAASVAAPAIVAPVAAVPGLPLEVGRRHVRDVQEAVPADPEINERGLDARL